MTAENEIDTDCKHGETYIEAEDLIYCALCGEFIGELNLNN